MNLQKPTCISGLISDTKKIMSAGQYTIYTRTTDLPPSGLVVTISQSGSASHSFSTPTTSPLQTDVEMNATFNCAVNDILTVAVTSSATADQPPNMIKTIINLRQGI